jgi:uncharacterized protein (TIGR03435 family)
MRFAIFFVAAILSAQSPAFEVATVKPSSPEERSIGMYVYPGGRMTVTNYTLRMLVHEAWLIEDFLIEGGPKWATEDRYSIVATPPAGSKSSQVKPNNPKLPPIEEERLMLQSLLAERFKLVMHEETKEAPAFALTVAGQGNKMKPPKDPDDFPVVVYGRTGHPDTPDFLRAYNAGMQHITKRFSDMLKRPVVDQTGLQGSFDFFFEYVQGISEDAHGPSLVTAVQSIGLKLTQTKAPVRHVVIDGAEKPEAQ